MTLLNTTAGPKGLYPDQTFLAADVVPDALIYQLATLAGSIEGDEPAIRVPYVKTDPTVGFVPEGDVITPSDPELDELVIRTGKLAVLTRQTNESSAYGPASSLAANSMARALTIKGNSALLSNATAAGQPTGLLNIAGITDAGTLTTDLDAIGDAITALEVAGGTATHVIAAPDAWGTIRGLKAATGSNLPLIGAPSDQTDRRLFGLPVLVSPQMAAGTVLVSDRANIIAAVGQIKLATSDQVYFNSDSLARRATWRIGWEVLDPKRLAKVTVNAG